MQKSTHPITQPESFDYELSERLTRYLQDSWLHVHIASVVMSMPKEIVDPRWPTAEMMCDLTLLTDGVRGWLVVHDDDTTWNVPRELNEFIEGISQETSHGVPVVFQTVEREDDPQPYALDLRDLTNAAKTLEDAFESHFHGAPRAQVDGLPEALRSFGYSITSEDEIRQRMSEAA
ncbi:MAG: hypothetical protein AB8I08_34475 [Sandaracinaceae bacterium]